ncbi:alanine--tRNA ligase [Mucisphaera calidilacus]|uniref:Alanine--tRNA ligase n=1 Tax=Mucisphaera calidilacus TaxID=2527982 RepID=A0A518BXD2_9BACT|nr:alanine--tRNA ligase [Mucisphaera calidilacus]QDU71639.1 Alanine--tRNA ligase [Mucisphaera calidilacus]
MLTSSEIREQFVRFFVEKHGHRNVVSSPVVPHDDPTLLFANAGMNQFKPYFLGTEEPESKRAANTQKCIRAGGKHNDLDDVGKDTYHHTFFEMLGNWSFGDYFKAEAIAWAWELLVDQWGLDPERLHATYFEGDEAEGLEPDLEAKALWGRYLPEERIHPGNKKDNFWEMGDVGPCGPCSELHYDGTADKQGGRLVNADNPDVIEIWNLVFIQFNRTAGGQLESLPARHVDTGMGFERIVRVLQGKDSNYDTDVFGPLFEAIQKATGYGRAYEPGGSEGPLRDPINVAYRVIADHVRCLTFALADGAHCGNKARDAVLRTILRRAVRFGHQTLGVEEPFLYKLVPAVVEHMGAAFPEITKNPAAIEAELKEEEISFRRTLERGIGIFDKATEGLKNGQTLPGDTAFDLEATYGFPISLTQVMAEERGLTVDLEGYERAKAKHADVSRGEAGTADLKQHLIELVQKHDLPDTDFLGYEAVAIDGTADAEHQSKRWLFAMAEYGLSAVEQAVAGDRVVLVTERTVFYGEAGGQVGDTGTIACQCGAAMRVEDTQKIGGVWFHIGVVTEPTLAQRLDEARPIVMRVDEERRRKIMANHTTTHVLNRALRDLVNEEAMQRGSLVDDEKLRFDFSNDGPVSLEQVAAVEKQVNDDIAADLPVYAEVADQEAALRINGLRAVFGEKYPPRVRVVSIGADLGALLAEPKKAEWARLSIEFCGGTHLRQTGEAQGFVILSEENVAKGIRRLTGLTGEAGHRAQSTGEMLRNRVESLEGAPAARLAEALPEFGKELESAVIPLVIKQSVREKLASLQDALKAAQKEQAKEAASAVADVARALADSSIDGEPVVAKIEGADANALRTAMDVVRSKLPASPMMLVGVGAEKVALLAAVPKDLIGKGLKAGDWVKAIAPVVGGGGGGRPDMAQAGGRDPGKADEAVEAARAFVAEKVGG